MAALTCSRCGKPAPDGETGRVFMCLTCQLVTDPAPATQYVKPPGRTKKWPWLVVAAVVVAGGIGAVIWAKRRSAQQQLAMRYPIAASEVQAHLLEKEAAKWRKGRKALLATLAGFQRREVPESGAPCPLTIAIPREADYERSSMDEKMKSASDRDPTESLVLAHENGPDLVERVTAQLDVLLETADRARFHSVRGRHLAITATALPLIVMDLEKNESPGRETRDMVIDGIRVGSRDGFVQGHRAGTAYVFDKETGALRCAGRFEAFSSEQVEVVKSQWGGGSENDAIELDFQNNTVKAIASAVHAVE